MKASNKEIQDVTKLLEPFQSRISSVIDSEARFFEMNQPCKAVTVKTRGEHYKIVPLIGGETFTLTSLYMGKRDGLIFRFKPNYPCNYGSMEMNALDARNYLDDFGNFIDQILASEESQTIGEAREKAREAEMKDYVELGQSKYGELYGSW